MLISSRSLLLIMAGVVIGITVGYFVGFEFSLKADDNEQLTTQRYEQLGNELNEIVDETATDVSATGVEEVAQ